MQVLWSQFSLHLISCQRGHSHSSGAPNFRRVCLQSMVIHVSLDIHDHVQGLYGVPVEEVESWLVASRFANASALLIRLARLGSGMVFWAWQLWRSVIHWSSCWWHALALVLACLIHCCSLSARAACSNFSVVLYS